MNLEDGAAAGPASPAPPSSRHAPGPHRRRRAAPRAATGRSATAADLTGAPARGGAARVAVVGVDARHPARVPLHRLRHVRHVLGRPPASSTSAACPTRHPGRGRHERRRGGVAGRGRRPGPAGHRHGHVRARRGTTTTSRCRPTSSSSTARRDGSSARAPARPGTRCVDLLGKAAADAGRRAGRARPAVTRMGGQDRADRVDRELRAAGIEPGDPSLYPAAAPLPRRRTRRDRARRRRHLRRPARRLGRPDPRRRARAPRRDRGAAAADADAAPASGVGAARRQLRPPRRARRLRLGRRGADGRLRRPRVPARARARGRRHRAVRRARASPASTPSMFSPQTMQRAHRRHGGRPALLPGRPAGRSASTWWSGAGAPAARWCAPPTASRRPIRITGLSRGAGVVAAIAVARSRSAATALGCAGTAAPPPAAVAPPGTITLVERRGVELVRGRARRVHRRRLARSPPRRSPASASTTAPPGTVALAELDLATGARRLVDLGRGRARRPQQRVDLRDRHRRGAPRRGPGTTHDPLVRTQRRRTDGSWLRLPPVDVGAAPPTATCAAPPTRAGNPRALRLPSAASGFDPEVLASADVGRTWTLPRPGAPRPGRRPHVRPYVQYSQDARRAHRPRRDGDAPG